MISPLILNIETATEICSVCLSCGKKILSIEETQKANSHSNIVTILIAEVFKKSNLSLKNLDAVAFSAGPGSYTGLRIGAAVAKGLCYSLNIPLISINTLESMAQAVQSKKPANALFAPMLDARRMEVYSALYDISLNTVINTQSVVVVDQLYEYYLKNNIIYYFGTGMEKVKYLFTNPNCRFISNFLLSATSMVEISSKKFELKLFESTAYGEPIYLKSIKMNYSK